MMQRREALSTQLHLTSESRKISVTDLGNNLQSRVCVCVCRYEFHVRTYVFMYVHTVCAHVCVHGYMGKCVHVHIHVGVRVHT